MLFKQLLRASVVPSRFVAFLGLAVCAVSGAQGQSSAPSGPPQGPAIVLQPLELGVIDKSANPCTDFYQYACGNFAQLHPIPADQAENSNFYQMFNLNTQQLNGILTSASRASASRTPNEQKIGDYYAACMDTTAMEANDMKPVQPLLEEIDRTGKLGIAELAGKLQRIGVNVLFSYGEMQDFKDAARQIAVVDQGGLGLPEKDYYLRDTAKDKEIRQQYVAHITKMLGFAGVPPQRAVVEANKILAFETTLAKASQGVTERRDPKNIYHMMSTAEFQKTIPHVNFRSYLEAMHSPAIAELNVTNPGYMPALLQAILATDSETLHAYMTYQVLTAFAGNLPKRVDDENFDFYSRKLRGQQEPRARWKRCSSAVDDALGEAVGQVYVTKFFPPKAKAQTLQMVGDIEQAMEKDIDSLEWMSPATRVKAKEKLHAIANKIGYPDKFRDYSSLTITRNDPVVNLERSTAFENDRQLAKIGKPVDKGEWSMTPATVNAYYNSSMNNINFPAGILQKPFYDPSADLAVNYGHIGAIIGHELTHGFDDEGRKFGPTGNLDDWWTTVDTQKFDDRASCLVKEYSAFPVGDVKVNGQLTLGENTADNGGLVLAYAALLDRAKKSGLDLSQKVDGYTMQQRFYLAYAQNWCEAAKPEALRAQVLSDPHAPSQFRANGAIVNQPGFGPAFGCRQGTPMVPVKACRVW